MFHSLRILNFGIQLLETGTIKFDAMNEYYYDLEKISDWTQIKDKYQPIYNALKSKLKLLAPK